jgi:tetratricopeptide (TPR) repeat protein
LLQGVGHYGEAQSCGFAALEIQQAIGDRWMEISSWNNLGIQYQELGALDQAQECLQRGLELSREIGDKAGEAYVLANLGLVLRDEELLEQAEQTFIEGLALARRQEDKDLEAGFLSYCATVNLQKGAYEQAISQAEIACTIYQELELPHNTTITLSTMAAAYLALTDISRALTYAHQTLTILDECRGEGPEFPQRDYFICHQVFVAGEETATAQHALEAAYHLVMIRTEKITDPDLRRSFLERVTINHQIVDAMHKETAPPPEEEQGCPAD